MLPARKKQGGYVRGRTLCRWCNQENAEGPTNFLLRRMRSQPQIENRIQATCETGSSRAIAECVRSAGSIRLRSGAICGDLILRRGEDF